MKLAKPNRLDYEKSEIKANNLNFILEETLRMRNRYNFKRCNVMLSRGGGLKSNEFYIAYCYNKL